MFYFNLYCAEHYINWCHSTDNLHAVLVFWLIIGTRFNSLEGVTNLKHCPSKGR